MVAGACYESIYRPCHRAMLNTSPTELAAFWLDNDFAVLEVGWQRTGPINARSTSRETSMAAPSGSWRIPTTLDAIPSRSVTARGAGWLRGGRSWSFGLFGNGYGFPSVESDSSGIGSGAVFGTGERFHSGTAVERRDKKVNKITGRGDRI